MKLLIVDSSAEAQAFCAKRIDSFGRSDMEVLDLKVKLVNDVDYAERVSEADVVVLGSGLVDKGASIARQTHMIAPWVQIIMFVTDSAYGGGAFRAAHQAGVRKVFPDSASPLDFLQELVAIHSDFRKEGRTHEGKVVLVAHAKGGVGATSITAALGELCSVFNRRTMLWDLDVETRDLSRSLTVNGEEARVVSSWVNGSRDISRESLRDALIPISSDVSVLMPPDRFAESMDLVCHADGMGIAQRVVDIARVLFDVVLIDSGGRMGPAVGGLVRSADVVLLVIDDTVLGLTAVDLYLSFIKSLIGSTDKLCFLVNPYSGAFASVDQIAADLEPAHQLGDAPWRLPSIPNDPKAAVWPGSGRTLYSMGQKGTRNALEQIAKGLGILQVAPSDKSTAVGSGVEGSVGLFRKLFGKR